MPWMIGRAFEKIGDPEFLTLLGKEKDMPGLGPQLFLNEPLRLDGTRNGDPRNRSEKQPCKISSRVAI